MVNISGNCAFIIWELVKTYRNKQNRGENRKNGEKVWKQKNRMFDKYAGNVKKSRNAEENVQTIRKNVQIIRKNRKFEFMVKLYY